MRGEGTAVPPVEIRNGTCVVDGFGIRIEVRRGHLVISDGTGRTRRRSTLARATASIRHLIVVGHTGSITVEALRWLSDIGIDYVHLAPDGRILATSGSLGLNDPSLRRAQALAATTYVGIELTRWLLVEKLSGQRHTLLAYVPTGETAATVVDEALVRLDEARTLDAMRLAEADAARAYWGCLEVVPLHFAKNDEGRVPEHWLKVGTRSSPLTGNTRRAANPSHAILNYLYAVLEAQTRIACMKGGLDPGLGILHSDQPARDSMALDLMEVVRPAADAELLRLLAGQVLRASDFLETRQGDCRVLAPLSHQLSRYAAFFSHRIGPVAERAAQTLSDSSGKRRRLPTHLSQSNRSNGRAAISRPERRSRSSEAPSPVRACPRCGTPLDPRRSYCDACLQERRNEVLASLSEAGPAALARMRIEGRDPTTTESARQKLGRADGAHNRSAAAWERGHERPHPDEFRLEIMPGLQGVPPCGDHAIDRP